MYDIVPLCTRLRDKRAALGVPVQELAKSIGVSRAEMYLLEAGKRKGLSITRLAAWCAALGEPFTL